MTYTHKKHERNIMEYLGKLNRDVKEEERVLEQITEQYLTIKDKKEKRIKAWEKEIKELRWENGLD